MDDLFSLEGQERRRRRRRRRHGPRASPPGSSATAPRSRIADVNEEALEQVGRGSRRRRPARRCAPIVVDCTDEEQRRGASSTSAVADMGRVDVLVNAHGYNVKAPATEFPMDEWDKLFSVNVRGVMMCCKHFGAAHGRAGRRQDHQPLVDARPARRARRQPRLLREQGRRGHDHQAAGRASWRQNKV